MGSFSTGLISRQATRRLFDFYDLDGHRGDDRSAFERLRSKGQREVVCPFDSGVEWWIPELRVLRCLE